MHTFTLEKSCWRKIYFCGPSKHETFKTLTANMERKDVVFMGEQVGIVTSWKPLFLCDSWSWRLSRACKHQHCPSRVPEKFQFHFNLMHPWWLQFNAIRMYPKPSDGFYQPFQDHFLHFQEKLIFSAFADTLLSVPNWSESCIESDKSKIKALLWCFNYRKSHLLLTIL